MNLKGEVFFPNLTFEMEKVHDKILAQVYVSCLSYLRPELSLLSDVKSMDLPTSLLRFWVSLANLCGWSNFSV